jgi:hypothetical protein
MPKKRGGRTRNRKLAVISYLIRNKTATTDQLIDALTDHIPKKNPYAALTKPLNELRSEEIVPVATEKIKQNKGAPHQLIQIITTHKAVNTIFEMYPECRKELYGSDWVLGAIIETRITCPLSNALKNELKGFLRSSPSFFRYLLTDEGIEEKAHDWFWHVYAGIVDHAVITEQYRRGKATIPKKLFHEFFYLCAFIDMLNGEMTPEARKFIGTYERAGKK